MTPDEQNIPELADLRTLLRRPVVLVGLMGSGKTRLGQKLAGMLDIEFHDADRAIEDRAGYSIAEIFQRDGEEKFRDVEKKTMLELLDKGICVIASGGGAVTNETVRAALKEKSVAVWLKADVKELAQRLRNAQDRPLLKNGNPQEILEVMERKRAPLYGQSDLAVDTAGLSPEQAISALIKGLYGFLKPGNL
jgi:shikimate kinase